MVKLDSDEIKLLSILDNEHKEKWLSSVGVMKGLCGVEEVKLLEFFNLVITFWDKCKVVGDVILDLIRLAVIKLYSDEEVSWMPIEASMKYRILFDFTDYIDHFTKTFSQYETFFIMFDHLPEKKKIFMELCAKDYFSKLMKEAFSKDYVSIMREKSIKEVLNK